MYYGKTKRRFLRVTSNRASMLARWLAVLASLQAGKSFYLLLDAAVELYVDIAR